jgi:hypothetical protein
MGESIERGFSAEGSMFTFPSLEWFRELARLMNENEAEFKRLGYADVVWAIEVQPSSPDQPSRCFRFVFEEYGCTTVEELTYQLFMNGAVHVPTIFV